MDLDQEFIELYEGWKKGKYTIKDKSGKILGTYNSGGKAQKAMDDLMQKGDYDKLEVSLVEAEVKHECPKCKGKGCDHCDGKGYHVEDEDADPVGKNEASAYRDRSQKDAKKQGYKKKYGKMPFVFTNRKRNQAGVKEESEIEEAVNLKQLRKQYDKNEDENRHTENYLLLAKAFGSKSEVKKVQDIMKRNEKQGHTSKSDMDWMYKNINPYYDKIRNEETMKLEDVVKQVLVGKKEEPTVEEQKVKKEDTDKDEPGTQGDMKKYQAARAKVMKKFGVKSCSELEGDEKKACYAALDAAHVSDDEEEKGEKKEEVKKSFSKMFTHVKSLMQGK